MLIDISYWTDPVAGANDQRATTQNGANTPEPITTSDAKRTSTERAHLLHDDLDSAFLVSSSLSLVCCISAEMDHWTDQCAQSNSLIRGEKDEFKFATSLTKAVLERIKFGKLVAFTDSTESRSMQASSIKHDFLCRVSLNLRSGTSAYLPAVATCIWILLASVQDFLRFSCRFGFTASHHCPRNLLMFVRSCDL